MNLPPIVFLIFNRPDATARTFAAIRAARPTKLLVVADGPRPERAGEQELSMRTRAIIDGVDWPCEVLRNYSDANMGCGRRVASGITWAFQQVEEAIILEDDCLPDPSFFPFCAELLERYRSDDRVMMISGNNFQSGASPTSNSYYFSQLPHCWGWATWRRAWRDYDYAIRNWPQRRSGRWIKDIVGNRVLETIWRKEFDDVATGKVDTWDFQWKYCIWAHGGLSIVPAVNLVTNIGFGDDATHTLSDDRLHVVARRAIEFPLRHPTEVSLCRKADEVEKRHLHRLPRFAALDFVHFGVFAAKQFVRLLLGRVSKIVGRI